MDAELAALAAALEAATAPRAPYRQRRLLLAVAESCTGGALAAAITDTAGSSAWFERGFVTYSNEAKFELLDVNPAIVRSQGAVSVETAAAMVAGALAHSRADLAVAITGIAGPGGGSPDKPVGTVCFGWCVRGATPTTERLQFSGDRTAVRRQAVVHALKGLAALAISVP
jgi:nicotinamide-nucleotide amidase